MSFWAADPTSLEFEDIVGTTILRVGKINNPCGIVWNPLFTVGIPRISNPKHDPEIYVFK